MARSVEGKARKGYEFLSQCELGYGRSYLKMQQCNPEIIFKQSWWSKLLYGFLFYKFA